MSVFLAAGHLVCLSICRILLAFLFLAFCIRWVQWLCYGLSPSVWLMSVCILGGSVFGIVMAVVFFECAAVWFAVLRVCRP